MINRVTLTLKDASKYQELRCTVCLEVEPSLMRCTGPCKTPLCLDCATNISKTSIKPNCPQRCTTEPLLLEPIPNFNFKVQFLCPYRPSECRAVINGFTSLWIHAKICKFMTPEVFKQRHQLSRYECSEGHLLYFLDEDVIVHAIEKKMLKRGYKCWQCGEHQECRSFCNECSQSGQTVAFCYQCRPIPCTQRFCPNGHEMVLIKLQDRKTLCDLCGFSMLLYSDYCYFDKLCIFHVCELCHQRLPRSTHSLVPLKTNSELKKERGMSLHDMILTKLMKNRSHQEAIRQLVNIGRAMSSEEDENEDAYFQSPGSVSEGSYESYSDDYSVESGQESEYESNPGENSPQPNQDNVQVLDGLSFEQFQNGNFEQSPSHSYMTQQHPAIQRATSESESYEVPPQGPNHAYNPINWLYNNHEGDDWVNDYDFSDDEEFNY